MASIKQAFQKVLDSTALATTKFIRRPPIDPKTPIQGQPRQPSSNAYKLHQEKEGRRLQKALNSLTHGQNIFVYHNLRTKQVVYSLTRYLEVSSNVYFFGWTQAPRIELPSRLLRQFPSRLSTVRNFLTLALESQCPQAMCLPWKEDCPRRSPQGHVGSLLLLALQRSTSRIERIQPAAPIRTPPPTLPT